MCNTGVRASLALWRHACVSAIILRGALRRSSSSPSFSSSSSGTFVNALVYSGRRGGAGDGRQPSFLALCGTAVLAFNESAALANACLDRACALHPQDALGPDALHLRVLFALPAPRSARGSSLSAAVVAPKITGSGGSSCAAAVALLREATLKRRPMYAETFSLLLGRSQEDASATWEALMLHPPLACVQSARELNTLMDALLRMRRPREALAVFSYLREASSPQRRAAMPPAEARNEKSPMALNLYAFNSALFAWVQLSKEASLKSVVVGSLAAGVAPDFGGDCDPHYSSIGGEASSNTNGMSVHDDEKEDSMVTTNSPARTTSAAIHSSFPFLLHVGEAPFISSTTQSESSTATVSSIRGEARTPPAQQLPLQPSSVISARVALDATSALLAEMGDVGVVPNAVSFHAILQVMLAWDDHLDEALRIPHHMMTAGVRPDAYTANFLLTAILKRRTSVRKTLESVPAEFAALIVAAAPLLPGGSSASSEPASVGGALLTTHHAQALDCLHALTRGMRVAPSVHVLTTALLPFGTIAGANYLPAEKATEMEMREEEESLRRYVLAVADEFRHHSVVPSQATLHVVMQGLLHRGYVNAAAKLLEAVANAGFAPAIEKGRFLMLVFGALSAGGFHSSALQWLRLVVSSTGASALPSNDILPLIRQKLDDLIAVAQQEPIIPASLATLSLEQPSWPKVINLLWFHASNMLRGELAVQGRRSGAAAARHFSECLASAIIEMASSPPDLATRPAPSPSPKVLAERAFVLAQGYRRIAHELGIERRLGSSRRKALDMMLMVTRKGAGF